MLDLLGVIYLIVLDFCSRIFDGSEYFFVKFVKLDVIVLYDDILVNFVFFSEGCSYVVLVCGSGIFEEYYVSEVVEDVFSCRGYRDVCIIIGKGFFFVREGGRVGERF